VSGAPARVPADWPHRDCSRSVRCGGLDWHVQVAGQGPPLLLLHGSGASAHSWAGLLPALAAHATVVAPDLPGHGYTTGAALADLTLPRITQALATLWEALALPPPRVLAGHSAGAALALRWALDAPQPPATVVGFNPSLVAPPAVYTRLLAPLVHPLATAAPVAQLLATLAPRSGLIDQLLASTQSALTPAQRACYRTLFGRPAHVRGALGFMAAADLPGLLQASTRLRCPVHFVLGSRDTWVPERPLRTVIERWFPSAEVLRWPGGHLLHEERPAEAAALLTALLDGLAEPRR
jgi:magnesium chelatase accessory protein